MSELRVLRSSARHQSRRSARFQASVTGLESRLALAAGVTGLPAVVYNQIAGEPITTVDPTNLDLPPSPGRPVPLVFLRSATSSLSASGFTATINWGDGTPLDQATIVPQIGGTLLVQGPDHTYARPALFAITISVLEPGDTTSTLFSTSVVVAAPSVSLSGELAASSNSGGSIYEGITNTLTPTFTGTTQPGAQVLVLVTPASDGLANPTPIGSAKADATGQWSVTSRVLKIGSYLVTAEATGQFGVTAEAPIRTNLMVPSDPYSYINIDNDLIVRSSAASSFVGPSVSGFHVTNARMGTFQITYADSSPAGLDLYYLGAAANYSADLITGSRTSRPLTLTYLNVNAAQANVPIPVIYPSVSVTLQVGSGTGPLPRNATILLTVHAAGLVDDAGIALDGEFHGKYPTGNGVPGGDYQVRINLRNGKVASLAPVRTAKTVRATSHHA